MSPRSPVPPRVRPGGRSPPPTPHRARCEADSLTSVRHPGFDAGNPSEATRYFVSAAATSSTREPHCPQSGHLPSHFGEENPQAVQAYSTFTFATSSLPPRPLLRRTPSRPGRSFAHRHTRGRDGSTRPEVPPP